MIRQKCLNLDMPNDASFRKISVSMPVELAEDLTLLSRELGVSRSALISGMLPAGVAAAMELVLAYPPNLRNDPEYIKRFRGQSVEVINDLVEDIMKEI